MTGSKSLPARPSLESLRRQAKKLARDSASSTADAVARIRAHLPNAQLPLTQRNAQLVIAREYGFAGWLELTAEVSKRLGDGLAWAAARARRAIHDNDIGRLTSLIGEFPALLAWEGQGDEGGLLGFATGAYGDSFAPERERTFTRADCAELLIDAGAIVRPVVCDGILESRARGLLQLFHRRGLLPRTLEFFAALGDVDAVRETLGRSSPDLATINEAFVSACRFEQAAIATFLLDRSIALDRELGEHIDGSIGRTAFIEDFIAKRPADAPTVGLWNAFVRSKVSQTIPDGDLNAFVAELRREPWLLGDDAVEFQRQLIESATLHDREAFISALLAMHPALGRRQPPPVSQALEFAVTYANTHLMPLLTRVWPLPDDLPYAAALGDLARVQHWFAETGGQTLGAPAHHYPFNDPRARSHLQWDPPSAQQVLDTAFAFAVINGHFDVADFLLEHGADINTNWNSHEPASILHHLVFLNRGRESMQYLIDRGIDMSIKDYRWNSTAQAWARYAEHDEELARWLDDAERQRRPPTHA
jgi:hypothetical protein